MKVEKKLTINDIAKLSGVAKSTVSRYLNGGSVRGQTAEKIRKVIEENNYEPNVFARLNAKNSHIIGLTVPGFDSVTTPRLVEVIVAYLKRYGYTPLIMHTGNDLEEEMRSLERLNNMNVDGIMVLASGNTPEYSRMANRLEIPVLFLGQRFEEENSVINDDYNAGVRLGRYLGVHGAKKVIGLWVGEEDPAVGRERKQGVMDGLKTYGVSMERVVETTFIYEDAAQKTRELLDEGEIPDTIVCATDRIAEGVYKVLYERNIRIPDEISVTGFGDYETSELLMPPLTTIRFDWKNWGEISAETMLQMIQGKPVSRLQVNSYQLIERKSVRKKTHGPETM